MAQATPEQIKELEKKHKEQFVNLIQAGRFRIMLADKYKVNSDVFKAYNAIFVPLVNKWAKRELKFEEAGAPKMNVDLSTFSTKAGISKAEEIAKDIDAEGKGIGFVPLLIWAVIAIAGFFTAEKITDELNNTAEEQTELINATSKICKDHGLNIEDCKKLITQQTDATKGGDGIFSGVTGKLFGLGIAALVLMNLDKFKTSK